jgi:hypothetical protein
MKFEEWQSSDLKRNWKIVRTDDYTEVKGEIITADEATGEYCVQTTVNGTADTQKGNLGALGLKIISRRR